MVSGDTRGGGNAEISDARWPREPRGSPPQKSAATVPRGPGDREPRERGGTMVTARQSVFETLARDGEDQGGGARTLFSVGPVDGRYRSRAAGRRAQDSQKVLRGPTGVDDKGDAAGGGLPPPDRVPRTVGNGCDGLVGGGRRSRGSSPLVQSSAIRHPVQRTGNPGVLLLAPGVGPVVAAEADGSRSQFAGPGSDAPPLVARRWGSQPRRRTRGGRTGPLCSPRGCAPPGPPASPALHLPPGSPPRDPVPPPPPRAGGRREGQGRPREGGAR